MGSSTVKYHLKQETPMWHFQCLDSGKQKGATLRGSDVKPRFDRFLIRQMEKENISWDSFRLSADHDALNYKIRITAKGAMSEDDIGQKAFFANMGRDVDKKHAIIYREGVDLQIMCFIPALMEEIQKHIQAFFLLNNFGTRQDKGFGGFIIDKKDGEAVNCNVSQVLSSYEASAGYTAYMIDMSRCSDKPLDNAYTLYQWIKSGINFRNTYKKSLLTTYMLDKGIGGEKRWMKEKGIAPKVRKADDGTMVPDDRKQPEPVEEFRYIRSVLGVTGVQGWFNGRTRTGKDNRIVNDKENISVSSSEIDRFQSAITIKYIKGKVYFIACNLDEESFKPLFDKEFSFGKSGKKLRTPSEFDMPDFMKYCASKVNGQSFRVGQFSYQFSMQEI